MPENTTSTERPRRERWLLPADQRRVMLAIADLIERNYVFPAVARVCAEDLRASEARRPGIACSALASELTSLLRRHDRHFSVSWGVPPSLTAASQDRRGGPALSFRRTGRIGVLTVRRFDDPSDARAAHLAKECLRRLEECDVAVIDLRENPGGWPTMVTRLLTPLLGAEPVHVVTFRRAGGGEHDEWTRPARGRSRLRDMPVFAVVDERTASAAEGMAYALQSTGRGAVVGRRTVGAANPVHCFAEPSGFHVYISTGAPIDPRTGSNWDQVGVRPDVFVGEDDDPLAAALTTAHDARDAGRAGAGRDARAEGRAERR